MGYHRSDSRRGSGGISYMHIGQVAAMGPLVAIGGAEDKSSKAEILRRVLSLAPVDNTVVGVITTASGIPEETFANYRNVFQRLGAAEVHHIDVRTREQARDNRTVQTAQECGTIFMSGGDQLRLTHVLGGSPLLEAIRKRHDQGIVVAGTSAGAAAMSATMIYNGAAADALRKGAVNMSAGLHFVSGVVIDSHFLERGRFTRLMEVGATNPEYLGIGIGEDAGVIVHNGTVLEAIGAGHVIVVDSSNLASSNVTELSDGEAVAAENFVMHALIAGYGYHVSERRFLQPNELNTLLTRKPFEDTGAQSPQRSELL
jgi:cyanophycinase